MKDVLLLDDALLSLGVETLGSVMTPVIERNLTIPVKKSHGSQHREDGQNLGRDDSRAAGRTPPGKRQYQPGDVQPEGVTPAPRGLPCSVEVIFDIERERHPVRGG
ncbi:Hsp70 family protein [Candidatus Amarobacter glycogenicus]|uniref:Hsp70 family protein n=1 Tax=Candidatus Amarobacter glycogenicus TaxID=3140699 RepID=UPI002A0FF436|nr:Hsp70 family protein [Dehalococcoidia bacterium]